MPQADGLRLPSGPFDAAAPSGSVLAPIVVGIEHSRFHMRSLGDLVSQVLNPDSVSVAFATFAV